MGNVVRGGIRAEENVYSSHTLTSISSLQSCNDVVGGREHNTKYRGQRSRNQQWSHEEAGNVGKKETNEGEKGK